MFDSAENWSIRMLSKSSKNAGEPSPNCTSGLERVGNTQLPAGKNNHNMLGVRLMREVSPIELPSNDAGHLKPRYISSQSRQQRSNRGSGKTTPNLHQISHDENGKSKLRIHSGSDSDNYMNVSSVCCGQRAVLSSFKIKNNDNKKRGVAKLPGKQHYEPNRLVGINKTFHQVGNDAPQTTMLLCLSMLLMMIMIILANLTSVAEAVDCFKCSSRNGSNPACEDPFHNLNTTRITSPVLPDPQPNVIYHTPCYAGRKGREGLFPASTCIKLTGIFDATGETLVVRHCALDSGTLTQDTELARMSHCGKFNFDGDSLKGCVLACPEDACNSVSPSIPSKGAPLVTSVVLMVLAVSLLVAQSPTTIHHHGPM